jgi:hypothetical protein
MTQTDEGLVDPWSRSRPTRFLGDDEPATTDGIPQPPRLEHAIRRHGGNGRPYVRIKMPTGEILDTETTYARVTTFIKCVDRSEALDRWQQQRAMEGFGARPEEFQARVVSAQGDRDALNGIWLAALDAGGAKAAAEMGTAMHRVCEWNDIGHLPRYLPEPYTTGLVAWIRTTEFFDFHKIEQFMVHDGIQVGGTPDRVVRYLPCENCGRHYYILDLKTGRVDDFTELQIAMQLGIYANSDYYDPSTGIRIPQDNICRCKGIIVKLDFTSGTAITYWTDIYTGWEIATEVATRVHAARKNKGLLVPFAPTPNLDFLIETAESRDVLKSLYHRHKGGLWMAEHTAAAERRIEILINQQDQAS